MKNYLISISLIIFIASPLYGQSSDEKKFAFRTAFVGHALTYNLDKQNGVGLQFGQFTTPIKEDNIEKIKKSFYGFNYAYAFDCLNCNSYFIVTFINNGSSVVTTDDGSTYNLSLIHI